jgi:hypothetical protein
MTLETEDLSTHVSLCELRYRALEKRLDAFEQRLSKLEDTVTAMQSEISAGFTDLKVLIEKQNTSRATQLTATVGAIIVAIIGLLGYLISR